MILVTGGLGFIGTHTTRALLDLGESCVLAQRRSPTVPDALAGSRSLAFAGSASVAGGRVFAEQVDLADAGSLLGIGDRYAVTGIVHLAGSVPWPPGAREPVDGAREAIDSLLNVFRAAREWGVRRVSLASTIGVYGGLDTAGPLGDGPLGEDLPLPMTSGHVIPAFKKIGELLADHLAGATGVEVANLRIAGIWGPLGRPDSLFFPVPRLVHAAARGTVPDLATLHAPVHAGNGGDLCYVKDCGRAIALLQLAPTLNHRTYNVASGRVTTNGEVAAAIRAVVPDARIDLPEGRDPDGPERDIHLDVTRLRQDTGFRPAYDTGRAVADYVDWLRAGNPR
jgi:UDP-glucose 4-epimerase